MTDDVSAQQRVPAWMRSYWLWAITTVVAVEGFLVWALFRAKATHREDLAGGCFDECIETWLGVVVVKLMLFVWPGAGLIHALILRGLWWLASDVWQGWRSAAR